MTDTKNMDPMPPDADLWFDLMSNGAVVQDKQGRIVRFNRAATTILGLTGDQLLGLSSHDPRWHAIKEDLSPSPGEEHPSIRALRLGQPVLDELMGVFQVQENRYRWLRVNSHPYSVRQGEKPEFVLTTFDDVTPWKEAQDTLRHEQQLFLQGPVVVLQRKGVPSRLMYVSENFRSVFGIDPEPYLSGKFDLWERFHDTDRTTLGATWQAIVQGVSPAVNSGQFRMRDEGGQWRTVDYRMVFDPGGPDHEPSTLSYWLDRTEESHLVRRLSFTLEAARAGTWEWSSPSGKVVFDNAWAFLMGYSTEELDGMTFQNWSALVHPSDQDLWKHLTESVVRGETVALDFEVRQQHRSGNWGWFQIRGKVFETDVHGLPIRILGTQEDVTDKVQAELERSALSQVVEQGPTAVILADLEGSIEYVNHQFTVISGYEPNEVHGKNPRIWKSPDADSKTYREMWQALTSGQPWLGELKNLRKDGTPYWVQTSMSPIKDASGRIIRYAGQQIDITARKAMDVRLQLAQEEAEAANRAKSDFLAHMSHEIRTPMTGILGMADLALARPLDGEARRQVETIKSSGETLLGLLNDILDVSKIEAGMMDLESVAFSLVEMLATTLAPLRVLAAKKGLSLEIRVDDGGEEFRTGDPMRLRQILTNLVGNAIKFTSQGIIAVTVRPADGRVLFSVRDTGPGVPLDRRHRLFQRFSQVETSTTRNFGGTGLGLAICRELVEKMQGQIGYADAQDPPGGTFWFSVALPPSPQPGASLLTAPVGEASASWKHFKVLVAEDNPVNQQVAVGLLGRCGVVPQVVSDGEEYAGPHRQDHYWRFLSYDHASFRLSV